MASPDESGEGELTGSREGHRGLDGRDGAFDPADGSTNSVLGSCFFDGC